MKVDEICTLGVENIFQAFISKCDFVWMRKKKHHFAQTRHTPLHTVAKKTTISRQWSIFNYEYETIQQQQQKKPETIREHEI